MADFTKYYYKVVRPWEGNFKYANVPGDSGGPTLGGVTIGTFRQYHKNPNLTAEDLKKMPETECIAICKTFFWDKIMGDKINSQGVAESICDLMWMSGLGNIKHIQEIVGVDADGDFGPHTLGAINGYSDGDEALFEAIQQERLSLIEKIIANRPTNEKFHHGWDNRINALTFS